MNFDFKKLDRDSFTYWMFVNLVSPHVHDQELWDHLRTVSNNWENTVLTMQINGVAIDASHFIDLIQRSMEARAESEAKKMISDALPDLDKLQDDLGELAFGIRDKVRTWADKNGIDFNPYDY